MDQKTLAVASVVLEDPPLDFAPISLVQSQLVVFDFDWSLADQDTDRWVHELLLPRLRIEFVERKSAYLLRELHKEGFTREQLEDALRQMPIVPLEKATTDTDFLLLSNSNEVYIGVILDHKGLAEPNPLFREIVTNPAAWDAQGMLHLSRRVPPDGPQHSCKVGCSANMCKGDELDAYRKRNADRGYQRIVYVGDGGNDYCPILRLGPQDVALVRRNRGLAKRILEEGNVQCQVRYWTGAWEAEQLLLALGGLRS
ncbi:hypothetical protein MVES_002417 [Malassezia vespertilionis]|uniref:Uncharacterized protein n=1 Tax=Malassezia vespertilionis TaxID=2020962 RepID=A0A2N1JAC9_9BASI|nr:hypothetical protein MVES_002417 [Malassezia vespertilionis]